jgi:predicted transposase YdaD
MQYITTWEQDAMLVGKAEGKAEGLAEGIADGNIPEELIQRMQVLSESVLVKLANDLLSFRNVDDLERWLELT